MLGESRLRIAFFLSGIAVACGSSSGESLFSGADLPGGGGSVTIAGAGGSAPSSGGRAPSTGAAPGSGGSPIGGASSGGSASGGAASGGASMGGAASGGAQSGGAPQTGGARTGGAGSGGKVMAMPTCTDGAKNGDETAVDCGGATCPGCGSGQACTLPRDCTSGVCQGVLLLRTCRAATCADQVKNGTETDIDCGGSCSGCANGHPCLVDMDCTSGACEGNVCVCKRLSCDALPHACGAMSDGCGSTINCRACSMLCSNGSKDGNETAVDCGGPDCKACSDGLTCAVARDCVSLVCKAASTGAALTCRTATCMDLTKNNVETDIDCGGGTCPACKTGRACKVNTDCESGPCVGNKCTCVAKTCGATDCGDIPNGCGSVVTCQPCANLCADGILDGNELGIDCGGPDCAPCMLPP